MDKVQYIKESCEHQDATTPEDFIGMTRAFQFATFNDSSIDLGFILELYYYVNNKETNIRKTPVVFQNGNSGLHPQLIMEQLEKIISHQFEMSPEEFYKRFEEIHPCFDGNGRVGSILFNWLNNSLDDPIHPECVDELGFIHNHIVPPTGQFRLRSACKACDDLLTWS